MSYLRAFFVNSSTGNDKFMPENLGLCKISSWSKKNVDRSGRKCLLRDGERRDVAFPRDGAPFGHRAQWYDLILFLTKIIQIFRNFMKINKKI